MADVLLSDVVFRRLDESTPLHVRLASPIERKPGIGPGLIRAFAPDSEVKSFGSDLGGEGTITLDDGVRQVELRGYRIVDAYPGTLDADGNAVEWELFFADHRRIFVKPLGGELALGEVNRAPLRRAVTDGGVQQDARGKDVVAAEDLVALCLVAMGVTPVGGVPTIPADRKKYTPTDLKWDGAWAPGELEELCKTFGLVFCPTLDGRFRIGVLDDVPWPNPPGPYVVTPLPAVGKPTDVIVFRSTPCPALETLNIRCPGVSDGFEWVLPDTDSSGRKIFVPVDQASWLSGVPGYPAPGTAMAALVRRPLGNRAIPDELYETLKRDLYRLLRVPSETFGEGLTPLDEVYGLDGTEGPPTLRADAASLNRNTATWTMPGELEFKVVAVQRSVTGPVLTLDRQAFKLKGELTSAADVTIWADAAALAGDDGYLRLTREQTDSTGKPVYFEVGFRRDVDAVGGLIELPEEEMATVARSAVVSAPSLVLISVEPEGSGSDRGDPVDNSEDLKEQALGLARVYLGDRTEAAEVVMPGYWPVELSGAVSAVSYGQTPPETRYTLGGHYRPASAKAGTGGAASVGHTPSRSTVAARAAAGAIDSSPRVRLLGDVQGSNGGGSLPGTFVQLDSREVGREKYRGSIISLKGTSSPSTNAFADLGPSPGESVLLVNIGGRSIGPTHTLALESIVGPVTFIGSIDMPPAEGSPQGTPRDRRRVCYIATDWTPFRQFRTREQGDNLILEGSHAAQPLQDSDWETILTFDLCPPPEVP